MAITMSGATVETGTRDSLLGNTVSGISGGATAMTGGFLGLGGPSGAGLAGVTASFAANVCNEIESYKSEINARLNELQAVESSNAFQGAGVKAALASFINAVRDVAESYTNKLSAAEQEIINSVGAAYTTQDSDLSGNLSGDAGTVSGNMV